MITGLILSGGRGRRVGGADKGLLPWQGRPRVAYSIDALRPHCDRLYLNCSRNPGQYARFGLPLLADLQHDFPGPLVALARLLPALPGETFLILPCDSPGVRAQHVAALLAAARRAPGQCLHLRSDGRDHPLHLLLPATQVPTLSRLVARGERRMMALLQRLASRAVTLEDGLALNLNQY